MGFARAKRADIETFGLQRAHQGEIIDLGIVGDEGDRGVAVERRLVQRRIRPFSDDRRIGEALLRRKGGARVG